MTVRRLVWYRALFSGFGTLVGQGLEACVVGSFEHEDLDSIIDLRDPAAYLAN